MPKSAPTINCPHCQGEYYVADIGDPCPHCGHSLEGEATCPNCQGCAMHCDCDGPERVIALCLCDVGL
jgi:C4-type Zn-finger protein